MRDCARLEIVYPEYGSPYGKCPLMNNGVNINEYLNIKRTLEGLGDEGFIVPNGECPFFNHGFPQNLCPYYR